MNKNHRFIVICAAFTSLFLACSTPSGRVRMRAGSSPSAPDIRWGPSGNPEGPHLLISDQATQSVVLVDLGGHVLQRYAVDGTPGGVTHDRREQEQGFWVCVTSPSSEEPILKRMDWYGETVDSIELSGDGNTFTGCRGLDMHPESDAEVGPILALVSNNVNHIDVVAGISLQTRRRAYETSFHDGNFLSGFWGNCTLHGPYQEAYRWTTHVEGRIERWLWSSRGGAQYPVLIPAPRGIACAQDGTFFVVDQENHRVVVLTENGELMRSFPTPDVTPAGISWSE